MFLKNQRPDFSTRKRRGDRGARLNGLRSTHLALEPLEERRVLALTFNFNFDASVPANMQPAIVEAGQLWSRFISDTLVVNVAVKVDNIVAANTLMSTNSVRTDRTYTEVRTALVGDATSAGDTTATTNLPAGPALRLLLNGTANSPNGAGSLVPFLDADGDANNTNIETNRATQKALGLLGAMDAGNDATVTVDAGRTWDFTRADGITTGTDFVGTFAHELGHALGFRSGLGALDDSQPTATPPGVLANDDTFTDVTPLDLFRFSAASVAQNALSYSIAQPAGSQFFSLDAGVTSLATFSTGETPPADGNQSSHWQDNLGIGLMDPTVAAGLNTVSQLDLLALDVIGWNLLVSGAADPVIDGTAGSDRFVVTRPVDAPEIVEVRRNGTLVGQFFLDDLNSLTINGLGGNDFLTVDSSNGLIALPDGLHFDGGGGFDTVKVTQTGGPTIFNETIVPGTQPGAGLSVLESAAENQAVFFENIEPFVSDIAAITFNIPADVPPIPTLPPIASVLNASNAINYTQSETNLFLGVDGTFGKVTIDSWESIYFKNKSNLEVDAAAGSDTINLNNPTTPTGLTSITINGDDPTGSDTLIVNTVAGVSDSVTVQPTGQGAGTVTYSVPQPPLNFTGIEHLNLVGQSADVDSFAILGTIGSDSFAYNAETAADRGTISGSMQQFLPGAFTLVPITFSNFSGARNLNTGVVGGFDLFAFRGHNGDEIINVTQTAAGVISILDDLGGPSTGLVVAANMGQAFVDGQGGNDRFTYSSVAASTTTLVQFLGGGSDIAGDTLTYNAPAGAAVNLSLATNVLSAPNMNSVDVDGIESVIINTAGGALTVTGVNGTSDDLTYTPTGASSGRFQTAGSNTVWDFINVLGTFTVTGGTPGTEVDTVRVNGTTGRDTFTIDAAARTVQVTSTLLGVLKTVVLNATVDVLYALGLAGDDVFNVVPAAGVPSGVENLSINIDGGDPQATDALNVTSAGGGTLAANQFVVVNKGRDPNSGVVRVYTAAVRWPDITYKNVEVVSPRVFIAGINPNLLILGPDTYEPNETQANASFLGSGSTLQIQHASIFPGFTELPSVVPDQDWYRVVAQQTGTMDFQVYFKLFSPLLLPGGGALRIEVVDSTGAVIGTAGAGVATVFGAAGATADARVRIPAVAGQSYWLRVFGQPGAEPNSSTIINGYDATIINTPAPQPFNLALSRNVPPGTAGAPDTGDLPPNAINSDSGRSQFDNTTFSNLPTIYIRLNDGILLNDLQGNGTAFPNNPPAGVIPIPFSPNANTAGFRVAIFDGNDSQNPVPIGFATPVNPVTFPGLYQFTFTTPLADGLHHINAAVQMVDPQTVKQTGFGAFSLHSLDITVDTAVPPVFFGLPGVANDGLDPPSDSGVTPVSQTFVDRITNVTAPTFFGTAEANSIIRLFATFPGAAAPVLIGQTVAIPLDGTNAFPNGRWVLKSNVDLNDPTLFPRDGVRLITVTAEDLAGNVSPAQQLSIFIDTQGPQVTNVQITDDPGYNLFGLKPQNAFQGPTPLVFSLTISLQDLPAVDAAFLRNAIVAGIASTPGVITLRGDHNGIILIDDVIVTNLPNIIGQPAAATIELRFNRPLPDDRFTLTVSDVIPDPAGNRLDGENNAMQPTNTPLFPTGDGQPGGNFVARFTVDSRPEIGTYAAANVYVDANGNLLSDPQGVNNDFTNRDLTFGLGIAPSLQGIVSPMGVHDGVFAGNFPQLLQVAGAPPFLRANGYDKLAAYGYDPIAGGFRWLIDTNDDGVIDPAAGDHATIQPAGFQINGLPVAGEFDGNLDNGDEIGLFTGTAWYFDTNHDYIINNLDVPPFGTNLRGIPIVGDFNGDGIEDLATWKDDVFYFNFGAQPGGAGTQPVWSGAINATINWGLPGNADRPIAADMDMDGITDIGLWVPSRAGTLPSNSGNWQFLLSNSFGVLPVGVSALNHPFSPAPLGNDIFAQFGDNFALPLVGNFDPPIAGPQIPTPTTVAPLLAPLTVSTTSGSDKWFEVTPLRSGTLRAVANTDSTGVHLYAYDESYNLQSMGSGTGVGQVTVNVTVQAGKTYLLRVSESAAGSLKFSTIVPDGDRLDTTRDGSVTPADVLRVINELLTAGPHATPAVAGNAKMYLDTNVDGQISPVDVLQVVNFLLRGGPSASPLVATSVEDAGAGLGDDSAPAADPGPTAAAAVAVGLSLTATTPPVQARLAPASADAVYDELAAGSTASASPLGLEYADQGTAVAVADEDDADELELDWLS